MERPAVEEFIRLKLRQARTNADLTVEKAAEASGVSDRYIRYIEAGHRPNIAVRTMTRLLSAYGVTFEEFFRGCDAPKRR